MSLPLESPNQPASLPYAVWNPPMARPRDNGWRLGFVVMAMLLLGISGLIFAMASVLILTGGELMPVSGPAPIHPPPLQPVSYGGFLILVIVLLPLMVPGVMLLCLALMPQRFLRQWSAATRCTMPHQSNPFVDQPCFRTHQ